MQAKALQVAGKKAGRQYYIDALRVLAVFMLIIFHSSKVFDLAEDWNVYNEQTTRVANILQAFIHPWHMQLFILLAGASTWFALRKRTGRQYTAERFLRILLPYLFGTLLLICSLQLYIWRLHRNQFDGNFLEFLPTYYTTGPAIDYEGNFSHEHLWFLIYLFIIAMAALPLLRYLRGEKGRTRIGRWAARAGSRAWLLFIPSLPIFISQLLLRPIFPDVTHGIVDDWAYMVYLFLFFVYGAILVADDRFGQATVRNWKPALLLALALTSFDVWNRTSGLIDVDANLILEIVWAFLFEILLTWFWLVALLGLGKSYLDKPSRLLSHLSEIAYPYYIWHQTVIVILAYWVVQMEAGILVKYLLLAASSAAITYALSVAIKATDVTRFLFGMRTSWKLSTQTALRLGYAGLIVFVAMFGFAFAMAGDNPQTADFPEPQSVAAPAETVGRVSGVTYEFDDNQDDWEAMRLTFARGHAFMQLVIEGQSYDTAIGLDGRYLPNATGTAKATGFWRSDEDFVVYFRRDDYREIWDIKFPNEDEVLFRLRDGVGVILRNRFTGTR
jgi:glucan biosynthesis protein C